MNHFNMKVWNWPQFKCSHNPSNGWGRDLRSLLMLITPVHYEDCSGLGVVTQQTKDIAHRHLKTAKLKKKHVQRNNIKLHLIYELPVMWKL